MQKAAQILNAMLNGKEIHFEGLSFRIKNGQTMAILKNKEQPNGKLKDIEMPVELNLTDFISCCEQLSEKDIAKQTADKIVWKNLETVQ